MKCSVMFHGMLLSMTKHSYQKMSRYLFLESLSITSGSNKVIIIWHKWWLPPRLSNHQSLLPTAVLSRPTLTQTIRQHNQILLLQVVKPLLFRNNWLQKLWFKLYINLILTKSVLEILSELSSTYGSLTPLELLVNFNPQHILRQGKNHYLYNHSKPMGNWLWTVSICIKIH